MTGNARSTDFPTTGGFDTTYGGGAGGDAFVTKASADGSSLAWSSYLGGTSSDSGYGIAVDIAGSAYVTGLTGSGDFPATGGFDTTLGGGFDAFVTKVNAEGSSLGWSSYLGGSGGEYGYGIAWRSENAYVTGYTTSTAFPTTSGFDTTLGGTHDAFVTRIPEPFGLGRPARPIFNAPEPLRGRRLLRDRLHGALHACNLAGSGGTCVHRVRADPGDDCLGAGASRPDLTGRAGARRTPPTRDDDDACTTGEACSAGTCGGGTAIACVDDNVCTTTTRATPRPAACSRPTTRTRATTATPARPARRARPARGGGTAVACVDLNACTDDTCDPATGCEFTPDDTNACDDGDACTTGERAGRHVRRRDRRRASTATFAPTTRATPRPAARNIAERGRARTATRARRRTCARRACVPGAAVSCDDGNVCTDDVRPCDRLHEHAPRRRL